jgi:putative acetyltransferase
MAEGNPPLEIRQAATPAEVAQARELLVEYAASLDFELCFQAFERELAELPGAYAPPRERLLLAYWEGALAGVIAFRPYGDRDCEMKRFYVRPAFRGKGIGKALTAALLAAARAEGYRRMVLDTVPSMAAAIALYEGLGFTPTAPYCHNLIAGATFMMLEL